MPLSDTERKALTAAVGRCRGLLEGEVKDRLERVYGFTRDGAPRALDGLALSSLERGVAEGLREWHRHLTGLTAGTPAQRQKAALARMAEETAFTFLHRLAAIRMAEERGVLRPCLREGLRSDGFRLFLQFAGGALGRDEEAYRVFLERVFDEIADDLPSLFDRREPRSLIFPEAACIEQVVAVLTAPELQRVWTDDEAIGWVYQDFHSAEERREIRRGNDAPRDSAELAVRNQLFTPRWVVEFLTDNTLGRLWVEMTGGETEVAADCAYLLSADVTDRVTPKDPRGIRVLDPACGSGHFLLYAFDLLERIYLDAWDRHVGSSPGRTPLWVEYSDRERLARDVPALILRHNLFGVDIDPRPIQVAALALWLRAQRSWKDVPQAERPRIERMNLVCAEPMPGDREQLEAFTAELRPAVLGDLVREVWQSMRPVGETGLLLRIEQQIRGIVRDARARWSGTGQATQPDMFDESPNWSGRRHDLSELARDEAARFWAEAEDLVVRALSEYAAKAGEHERVLRRLFAEDAERGLAFVDLSRARYDVVLMNPPFGQPAEGTKEALDEAYPACGHEIYAMFFQRALELLEPHGRVGAITNRTWLAVKTLRGLRETVFGDRGAVTLGADLGYGVLEAKVETCAVVVDRRATVDSEATWVRLLKTRRKDPVLYQAIKAASDRREHPYLFRSAARRFRRLPEGVYAYWMSEAVVEHFSSSPTIEPTVGEVKQGSNTARDFRFLRLAWEVDPREVGLARRWSRFAKGGEFRPYWDDIYLLVNWQNDGSEVRALGRGRPQNTQFFGRRGVTWPRRTSKGFGPRVLNDGCAFGDKGPTAFPNDPSGASALLALLVSSPQRLLLSMRLAAADDQPGAAAKSYEVSIVGELPWPNLDKQRSSTLASLAESAVAVARNALLEVDPSCEAWVTFAFPPAMRVGPRLPLREAARRFVRAREDAFADLADITAEIDDIVSDAYGFTDRDRELMDEEMERPVARFSAPKTDPEHDLFRAAYLTKDAVPGDTLPGGLDAEVDVRVEYRRRRQHTGLRDEETLCRLFELPPRRLATIRRGLDLLRDEDLGRCAADIASWAVGVAFGRWDVRLIDHPDWIPEWPDPFAKLPACPVGQLVDVHGLPATADHIASEGWLAARTDATRLPLTEADSDGVWRLVGANGEQLDRAETDFNSYPLQVAWDGILQDDVLDDGQPARGLSDLYRRVSQVLELIYGGAHAEREAELAAALGVDSVLDWLRHPDRFFSDHLSRYSRGNRLPRRSPIYWPLSTASGGFTLWLYYPRISVAMLSGCVNRLRNSETALQTEEIRLLGARKAGTLTTDGQARLERIGAELGERVALREGLHGLVNRGFKPHLDDGAVVNAAPLAAWFRHRPWREAAETVWAEVQAGEHDWSQLAMWIRQDEVLARCQSERDLAIAHGREDLYDPPPEKPGRRGRGRGATQLPLTGGGGDDDD